MIREEIDTSRFQTFCDQKEKLTYHHSHLFFFCPKNEILSPPQRGVLMSNSRIKIVCWRLLYWLKSQYRTVFLKYFPFLQNTAGKNPPKIAKYDFSRELKEKLREESRGEILNIEKRKRNFLQNLKFREENKNMFFKILTIEIISRN